MKPASISALAISTWPQKRWLKPTWRTTRASSQALTHAARGGGVDGKRLLAEHVLAVGRGGDDPGLMEAVRGRHDDRVEIAELEHRLEIVERPAAEIRARSPRRGARSASKTATSVALSLRLIVGAWLSRMMAPAPTSPIRILGDGMTSPRQFAGFEGPALSLSLSPTAPRSSRRRPVILSSSLRFSKGHPPPRGGESAAAGGRGRQTVPTRRGAVSSSRGTISLPIGHSAIPASLRCAQAKGRPMMVMPRPIAVIRWPSASHQPASTSQTMLPRVPNGAGADVALAPELLAVDRREAKGQEGVAGDVEGGARPRDADDGDRHDHVAISQPTAIHSPPKTIQRTLRRRFMLWPRTRLCGRRTVPHRRGYAPAMTRAQAPGRGPATPRPGAANAAKAGPAGSGSRVAALAGDRAAGPADRKLRREAIPFRSKTAVPSTTGFAGDRSRSRRSARRPAVPLPRHLRDGELVLAVEGRAREGDRLDLPAERRCR